MTQGPNHRHGSRIPKVIHPIPIYGHSYIGNGEDFRKWYKCGWCGFMCKLDREELGGKDSTAGISYEVFNTPSDPFVVGADKTILPNIGSIEGLNWDFISMELDSDGNPKELYRDYESVISGGCPQCGSLNWKGDYR